MLDAAHRVNWSAACLVIACVALVAACEELDKVAEFIDSISDGASCQKDGSCLGGECLTPDQGFPGGYCTTVECDTEGCSGLNSECFRTEVGGQQVTTCFELCGFDGSCDRADEGYECVQLDGSSVCLPPDATNARPQGVVGAGCTGDLQCDGEEAVCLTNWSGGYCSRLDCTSDSECLGEGACVTLDPESTEMRKACLATCSSDGDCRSGYACETRDSAEVCVESDTSGPVNPDGADDGESCVANINCKGGTCIREREGAEGEVAYPGGYCTTRDCDSDADCNGDALCISRERNTTCFATCSSDGDCRDGYECKTTSSGSDSCALVM